MTTAFVLSGGASHGAVQVGMLQALAERDVTPDLVFGASAGALKASDADTLVAAANLEHALTQALRIALDAPEVAKKRDEPAVAPGGRPADPLGLDAHQVGGKAAAA